jgi:hypothetical protein
MGKGEQHGENENQKEDDTDDSGFLGLCILGGTGPGDR